MHCRVSKSLSCQHVLAEVWHIAYFWVPYGRYAMPGLPMGRSEGLSWQWADYVTQVGNNKKHGPLHASGTLMAVLPCLDYP